jgi:Xaa-Pro aminopeptidase
MCPRIEDNLVITETGYRNLTTVPKVAAEVESIVRAQ